MSILFFCFLGGLGRGSTVTRDTRKASALTSAIPLSLSKRAVWPGYLSTSQQRCPLNQCTDLASSEEMSFPSCSACLKRALARNMLPDKTRHSSCISLRQIAASQVSLKLQIFFLLLGKDCQRFVANVLSSSNGPPKSCGRVGFLPG